jgi:predicted nucleic acid-binding protein
LRRVISRGLLLKPCREKLKNPKKFELNLPKIGFDAQAASEFGKIQGELRRMGKPTGNLDALIAAVARRSKTEP